MTLAERLDYRFGSPYRTHLSALRQWMYETGRHPTPNEIKQQFGWSDVHTLQVISRLLSQRPA